MSTEVIIAGLYVFALAAFLGDQVISRVPPLLHTPLMSATNAISGISLVGSLVTAGANYSTLSTVLGFIAVTASTMARCGRMVAVRSRIELGMPCICSGFLGQPYTAPGTVPNRFFMLQVIPAQ